MSHPANERANAVQKSSLKAKIKSHRAVIMVVRKTGSSLDLTELIIISSIVLNHSGCSSKSLNLFTRYIMCANHTQIKPKSQIHTIILKDSQLISKNSIAQIKNKGIVNIKTIGCFKFLKLNTKTVNIKTNHTINANAKSCQD